VRYHLSNNECLAEQEPRLGESMMLRSTHIDNTNKVTSSPTYSEDLSDPAETRPSAVLLVARDCGLNDSCRRTLSDAGIDVVVSVSNGSRALELLGENQLFDAVVIGVGPGDVEAVKLAQHIRRHRSDTPTLVMSSIGNLEISGAPIQHETLRNSNEPQQSNIFRRAIRTAVAIRRFARLRRPS